MGNKIDDENNRKIPKDEGSEKANNMNFKFEEVSAKSGNNIENLFNNITSKLVGEDISL